MSRQLNPSQIWSQLPVASRTVEVNTKTGFSLTAGSYSVRASSTQRGNGTNAAGVTTANTVSSVTTTRASVYSCGNDSAGNNVNPVRFGLTSSTNVNAVTGNAGGSNSSYNFELAEFF